MKSKIIVKCISCNERKTVGTEVKDIPMCDKCHSPMLVDSASMSK